MVVGSSRGLPKNHDDLITSRIYDSMARFLIKPFDAEAVVFDSASGDTHYLSSLAYQLLTMSQAPSGFTYQDISKTWALVEPHSDTESRIDEAIQSLQYIGLLGQA